MSGGFLKTCGTCGTAGMADTAKFCLECGTPFAVDPTCTSCGVDLPPGAKFCLECGTPTAAAAAPQAAPRVAPPTGTARKIASVLFGDLVGFTTISESRDAEEVRELLSAYFEECRAIVARYGGELEKFIGDAVMAVWGLPVTREDDAERAVRAGLELIEAVQALGDRIAVPGLNMRVGITTAEVAVNLGATGQGMVAGDPVNTAARIQSTASPGEVWVDETTRSFAASSIAFEDAGAHAMKGKAEPVPLWKVRAVVANARGGRTDGLEAQLISRDRELRLVKEVFHGVQESRRPGMLVVDGEAGIGKSRLSWEFEKYVDGFEAQVLWHRGRCLSYGEGVAYYALAEAVRGRVAVLTEGMAGDADPRRLLQHALTVCVPDTVERDWLEPRLAALLGHESGGSFPREDLFAAWTAFFKHLGLADAAPGSPEPVVLVIDDAQHADDGLLAFLEHLLAAADYPIFVLVLARPELLAEQAGLVGNRRVTIVHLDQLSEPEMGRLLDNLVSGLPEAIREELVARAEGIPLFAIETVRSMADQDLVVVSEGRYLLTDPDAVDLSALTAPASLQALIAARLDTLPAEERRVVDRASVLGLVFTAGGIASLCTDVTDLDGALASLTRREVVRRDTDRLSADFGSYRFVQGAVRQVAYGMLSRRDRKATHLTVARALEAELETNDGSVELAPIIAQHYIDAIEAVPADPDVADLTRASVDHLVRAAERAAALGAPRESAGHLAKALASCGPDRSLLIRSRLALQLQIAGDHAEAAALAEEALKDYEATGDLVGAAAPAAVLARSLVYGEGDLIRSERVVRELLERLPDTPETLLHRIDLVTALAAVVLRSGDSAELKRLGDESVRLAERSGNPSLIADSWVTFALGALADGMPQLSSILLERAAELAGEHRAMRIRGIALLNLVGPGAFENIPRALGHGQDAVAATREVGDQYMSAFAHGNLALALLHTDRWEEALRIIGVDEVTHFLVLESDIILRQVAHARGTAHPSMTEVVPDIESLGGNTVQGLYELDCAVEAHCAGREDAVDLALRSARTAHELSSGDDLWMIWLIATDIAISRQDVPATRELLQLISGPDAWPTGIRAQRARLEAILLEAADDDVAAEAAYRTALELAQQWESPRYRAHTGADYGSWLVRRGRPDEAAPHLAEARAYYERVGAVTWLEDLDRRV